MKILFIDQYNKVGGGQTILLQLIKIALDDNHKVSLLIPPGGEIKHHIHPEVTTFPLHGFKIGQKKGILGYMKIFVSLITFFRYSKILKDNDIIYVNGPRCFLPVSLISVFINKSTIYHIHLYHKGIERRIIKYISELKNTEKIIINSKFIYEKFQSLIKSPKLHLLENALPIQFNNLHFKDRFNNSENLNFAIIGRVSKEKGQDILSVIAKHFPNHKFYIIGDNDFASSKYLNSLKTTSPENVFFYGKSSNIIETINSLSIQVSLVPSKWEEPFGLTAIESMACSCLTIVSGKGELLNISNKTNALTYKDPEDLIRKVKKITEQTLDDLRHISYTQFSLTKKHYSFIEFRNNFSQLIKVKNKFI